MNPSPDWPTDPVAARAEQERLAAAVVLEDDLRDPPRVVAALDAHFRMSPEGADLTWAAAALMDGDDFGLRASALACLPTRFPYVPGLLSFREAPAMLAVLETLSRARPGLPSPELLVVDGQGTAHPRRFGLACHLGVLTGLPAIGIAKSRLVGRFDSPGPERGDWSPLIHRGEWIGAALRTRPGTHPVFVSPGHRVSLPTAVRLAMSFTGRLRIPEPIRLADAVSRMHG